MTPDSQPAELWRASAERSVIEKVPFETARAVIELASKNDARVVEGSFSPLIRGGGLGPVPGIVSHLIGERDPNDVVDEGWAGEALAGLLGREVQRDLGEIYAAIRMVLEDETRHHAVVVALYSTEFAGTAVTNLLDYLDAVGPAGLVVLLVTGPPDHEVPEGEPEAPERRAASVEAGTDKAPQLEAAEGFYRAGRIALDRADMEGAAQFLTRAAALFPPGDERAQASILESFEALLALGRIEEIVDGVRTGLQESNRARSKCAAARFRLWQIMVDEGAAPDGPPIPELRKQLEILEGCGDRAGSAHALEALAHVCWITEDAANAIAYMDRGLAAARASERRGPMSRMSVSYLMMLVSGPTKVSDAARTTEDLSWSGDSSVSVEIARLIALASLEAMVGQVDGAKARIEQAAALQRDIGQPAWVARLPRAAAWIELVDDAPERAAAAGEAELEELLPINHPAAIDAGLIVARARCSLGHFDEALELADRCIGVLDAPAATEAPDVSHSDFASVKAVALARMGRDHEALVELRRADAYPPPSPRLVQRAEQLLDQAEALRILDDSASAIVRANDAIQLLDAKGATHLRGRADAFLKSLHR